MLVIVCADSLAAQRLVEEVAALAPQRRLAFFPDWRRCRTTRSPRTRTWCPSGSPRFIAVARRMRRDHRHRIDALQRLPPLSYLAGRTSS